MKLKANKTFAILGLAAVVLGSFNFAGAKAPSARNAGLTSAVQEIKIVVIEALPAANTVVVAPQALASTAGAACGSNFFKSNTLVQDQALLNLNQPGECFELTVGLLPKTEVGLSVEPLIRQAQRIVVLPSARIGAEYYSNAPGYPAQTPIAPYSAVLAIFFSIAFGVKLFNFLKAPLARVKQTLTLHQLQVMRC